MKIKKKNNIHIPQAYKLIFIHILGTSKKDAKRAAASALLAKLKSMGNELSSISNVIPPANGNAIGDIEEELETAKNVNNMKVETLVSKRKSEPLVKKNNKINSSQ